MADENEDFVEDLDVETGEEVEMDAAGSGERVEVKSSDPLQLLFRHHPECRVYYAAAVTPKLALLAAPPDFPTRTGAPDQNHRSQPWLSQFERTKIVGFRSNQLAQGAKAYVDLSKHKHIVNTGEIARLELNEGRLPFIVARLMPDGQFEFWSLAALLIL